MYFSIRSIRDIQVAKTINKLLRKSSRMAKSFVWGQVRFKDYSMQINAYPPYHSLVLLIIASCCMSSYLLIVCRSNTLL